MALLKPINFGLNYVTQNVDDAFLSKDQVFMTSEEHHGRNLDVSLKIKSGPSYSMILHFEIPKNAPNNSSGYDLKSAKIYIFGTSR